MAPQRKHTGSSSSASVSGSPLALSVATSTTDCTAPHRTDVPIDQRADGHQQAGHQAGQDLLSPSCFLMCVISTLRADGPAAHPPVGREGHRSQLGPGKAREAAGAQLLGGLRRRAHHQGPVDAISRRPPLVLRLQAVPIGVSALHASDGAAAVPSPRGQQPAIRSALPQHLLALLERYQTPSRASEITARQSGKSFGSRTAWWSILEVHRRKHWCCLQPAV